MAEARARLISLKDVRASVKRMQAEGERIVDRIRHDARSLVERNGMPAMDSVLALADVRKQAERAMHQLDKRRQELLANVEKRLKRVAETIVKGLNAATQAEMNDLSRRVAQLERRVDTIKDKGSKDQAA